jgi:hypothetical protein
MIAFGPYYLVDLSANFDVEAGFPAVARRPTYVLERKETSASFVCLGNAMDVVLDRANGVLKGKEAVPNRSSTTVTNPSVPPKNVSGEARTGRRQFRGTGSASYYGTEFR